MMETIRIRRAGYPIRHTFADFVDRYRILITGVGPSHVEDCKAASAKICKAVLGNADFQLGKTKVFLKVSCIISNRILIILYEAFLSLSVNIIVPLILMYDMHSATVQVTIGRVIFSQVAFMIIHIY